ncbi:MAG: folate-binding protein YgfZ [Acidimicrobiia bacterium]|nr:folate-binding protein YgfZ [Acidimicrobiia bacterium]
MPDLTEDYWALRKDAGAVWLPRDFLSVEGPDAQSFLQGQLSQDIDALVDGASTWSFLLQPQGKVDAFLRVTRLGERLVLDTDAGWGDAVRARLNRFKLRIKADVEALEWRCLAVRGPTAHSAASGADADWPGLRGVDLLGAAPAVPDGVRVCDLDAYEAVRIEAGVPVMGREIDENTIPNETGVVDRAVSFTKGCYTGQELVARIDSRGGNVPRHLRGVVVGTNVVPPAGARVVADGKQVGALTSVAESLERRTPVGLAYVGRAVEPPAEVILEWDGGSAPARVEELPLVA